METYIDIIVIIMCILAEGFFSGSEIAFVSANKIKLRHSARKGSQQAKSVLKLLDNPSRMLGTSLIGTNICTITAAAFTTALLVNNFGPKSSVYAILIVTPLTLIVGEIMPKSLYQHFSNKVVYYVAYPFTVISKIFTPIIFVTNFISKNLMKLMGILPKKAKTLSVTKEEMELLLKMEHQEIDLEKDERNLIRRIFDFGEVTVKETLIPLVEVVAVERDASIREVIKLVAEHGYSRFPVYFERVDNIIGILHVFDLLYIKEDDTLITEYLRPAYYVPESKHIDSLLKELQGASSQMAIVVDEYGNCSGIVTLEDLLEEIVGEIHDEYETYERQYQILSNGSFIIDARMEIDQIMEKCGLDLPEGEFETLGGLILEKMGKIPDIGESLRIGNMIIKILKADGYSVKQVQVDVLKESPEGLEG